MEHKSTTNKVPTPFPSSLLCINYLGVNIIVDSLSPSSLMLLGLRTWKKTGLEKWRRFLVFWTCRINIGAMKSSERSLKGITIPSRGTVIIMWRRYHALPLQIQTCTQFMPITVISLWVTDNASYLLFNGYTLVTPFSMIWFVLGGQKDLQLVIFTLCFALSEAGCILKSTY